MLAWCAENRVQIDSRLQIINSQQAFSPRHEANSIASDEPSRERGLSVYSREELIECARTRESSSNYPRRSGHRSHLCPLPLILNSALRGCVRVLSKRPITLPPFQIRGTLILWFRNITFRFSLNLGLKGLQSFIFLCVLIYFWVSQSCIFQRPPFCLSSRASFPSTYHPYLMATVLTFPLLSRCTVNCA